MAEITLTKNIESTQPLTEDILKAEIAKILKTKFDKFKFLKKNRILLSAASKQSCLTLLFL